MYLDSDSGSGSDSDSDSAFGDADDDDVAQICVASMSSMVLLANSNLCSDDINVNDAAV